MSLSLVALSAPCAKAQSPYTSMQSREIKALSEEDVKQYRDGAGMGLALPAELNGYPGPKHILELAAQLKLTPEQLRAVQDIHKRMKTAASDLGARIVELERALDSAFANGTADAASLREITSGIGELQGTLRYTHLVAHIEARGVLSKHQLHEYARLRGYSEGTAVHHHKGH